MATIAELFTGKMGEGAGSERDDYLAYVQSNQEAGTTPLRYPEWVKAGRPKA